jgi:hypothetical protein
MPHHRGRCRSQRHRQCRQVGGHPKDTFGGQVGAPCGCIGQFGVTAGSIQGNWTNTRKAPGNGSFHATAFNSLVCGCDESGGSELGSNASLNGTLCNGKTKDRGPFPPSAPANLICFTGTALYSESGTRDTLVAFRVDAEDRSQPGGGKNPKNDPPSRYLVRIWIPGVGETAEQLAEDVACTGTFDHETELCVATRAADISDGGDLLHGAIQIHPAIDPHAGVCPVQDGECVDICPE